MYDSNNSLRQPLLFEKESLSHENDDEYLQNTKSKVSLLYEQFSNENFYESN
jgi:hypothetical protein